MAGTSFPTSRGGSTEPVMAVGADVRDGSPVLDAAVCIVRTSPDNDSVQLPEANVGGSPITVIFVTNPDGSPSAPHGHVWPAENGRIQGEGVDESISLDTMVTATFIPVSNTDWALNLSAAAPAAPPARTAESEAEAAKARVVAKEKAKQAKEEAAKAKAEAEAKAKAKAERAEKNERGDKNEHRHTAEA